MIFVRAVGTGKVRLHQVETYRMTWLLQFFAWLLMAFMTHKYDQTLKSKAVDEIHSFMMTTVRYLSTNQSMATVVSVYNTDKVASYNNRTAGQQQPVN